MATADLRAQTEQVYSDIVFGYHDYYPRTSFPRHWFVADGLVYAFSEFRHWELTTDGRLVSAVEGASEYDHCAPVVARDAAGNRYTLGKVEVWVDKGPGSGRNYQDCPVTARDRDGRELWRLDIPAGACWLLAGDGGYVVAAGVKDQFGIREGEVLWHLEQALCLTQPVLTADGVLHLLCEGKQTGYFLVTIAVTGDVIESRQLEYRDERMRFAFSPAGRLYAIDPRGGVEVAAE